jgi:hypothetical protein
MGCEYRHESDDNVLTARVLGSSSFPEMELSAI